MGGWTGIKPRLVRNLGFKLSSPFLYRYFGFFFPRSRLEVSLVLVSLLRRPGRSGHLVCAVCHGPAVRHGDVIH